MIETPIAVEAEAEALIARQEAERTRLIADLPGVQDAIRRRRDRIMKAMAVFSGLKRLPLLERVQAVVSPTHELCDVIVVERWLYGIDCGGAVMGKFK